MWSIQQLKINWNFLLLLFMCFTFPTTSLHLRKELIIKDKWLAFCFRGRLIYSCDMRNTKWGLNGINGNLIFLVPLTDTFVSLKCYIIIIFCKVTILWYSFYRDKNKIFLNSTFVQGLSQLLQCNIDSLNMSCNFWIVCQYVISWFYLLKNAVSNLQ